METVGIVGLGLLGHAVASRLRAKGHDVVGYDILPEKVQDLVALGGKSASSVEEVARVSDAVCAILPAAAAVEEAILGPSGIMAADRPDQTIIQMSTISPTLTERLAREVRIHGLAFLDAPVSGTSAMVARGEGVILIGGERALFDRWRPVLEAILPHVIYVGGAGQAMVAKLAANLLVGVNTLAAAEALLMAEKAGLDLNVVLEILSGGAATSRMLEVRGPMILQRQFPPQMKLDLFLKDLSLIMDAGERLGASLPLTRVAEQLYAAAKAAGHGEEDLASVVTVLEHLGERETKGKIKSGE